MVAVVQTFQYSIKKPVLVSGQYTIPYTQPGPIAIATFKSILECPEVYGPELGYGPPILTYGSIRECTDLDLHLYSILVACQNGFVLEWPKRRAPLNINPSARPCIIGSQRCALVQYSGVIYNRKCYWCTLRVFKPHGHLHDIMDIIQITPACQNG